MEVVITIIIIIKIPIIVVIVSVLLTVIKVITIIVAIVAALAAVGTEGFSCCLDAGFRIAGCVCRIFCLFNGQCWDPCSTLFAYLCTTACRYSSIVFALFNACYCVSLLRLRQKASLIAGSSANSTPFLLICAKKK